MTSPQEWILPLEIYIENWNLQVTVQCQSPKGKNTSRFQSRYNWQTSAMRSPSVTCSYAVSHPTPVVGFVTVAWLQVSINPWLAVILRDKGNSNQYSPAYPDTFTFWYQKLYRNGVGDSQSASTESPHLSVPTSYNWLLEIYHTGCNHTTPDPITNLLHPLMSPLFTM